MFESERRPRGNKKVRPKANKDPSSRSVQRTWLGGEKSLVDWATAEAGVEVT